MCHDHRRNGTQEENKDRKKLWPKVNSVHACWKKETVIGPHVHTTRGTLVSQHTMGSSTISPTLRVGLADSGYLLATLGGRMSRRRGIADSISESAPVANSAIIFGNAQLLMPRNGLHAADSATVRGHRSHPPGSTSATCCCRIRSMQPVF